MTKKENMELSFTYTDIARLIDHSLLTPTLTQSDLEAGCRLAVQYDVASVCIVPWGLKRCVEILSGSSVKAGTTVGFPHGVQSTGIKVMEARSAMSEGAHELDMVVNIGKVLSGDWAYVKTEIGAVISVAHAGGVHVKVIFENCYLADAQKIKLCEICGELRADWVKTSTGYGSGGATDADLQLMRTFSPESVQVKAAGGIRDFDRLLEVRALGVTRIGASRTQEILDECRRRLKLPRL
jgi:deoxyribose-phosphate aldolase